MAAYGSIRLALVAVFDMSHVGCLFVAWGVLRDDDTVARVAWATIPVKALDVPDVANAIAGRVPIVDYDASCN